jgi:hypothetical protein
MVIYSFSQNATTSGVLTINQLASEVQNGKVARIVTMKTLTVTYKTDSKSATSTKETGATL